MMSIGERIKARRIDLGFNQEQLATKAGVSKGFLSDLENGKRNVGAGTLLQIAAVLGSSLDYLMKGEGGAAKTSKEKFHIPIRLGELAESHRLTFSQTVLLLEMKQQVIAHRSAGGRTEDLEEADWEKFYAAVKTFL
jgi:transcriptional regulator with XRE-family HTH domain